MRQNCFKFILSLKKCWGRLWLISNHRHQNIWAYLGPDFRKWIWSVILEVPLYLRLNTTLIDKHPYCSISPYWARKGRESPFIIFALPYRKICLVLAAILFFVVVIRWGFLCLLGVNAKTSPSIYIYLLLISRSRLLFWR